MFTEFEIARIQHRIKFMRSGSCIPFWVFKWMQETISNFPSGAKIVEFGTFVGGTTRLLAQANPDKEIHSIDLNQFGDTFKNRRIIEFVESRFNLQDLTADKILALQQIHVNDLHNVTLYTGESTSIDIDRISVAFVDDNKHEEGMTNNLEFLWPKMIDGGVIFADDIDTPQIYNAFVKFAKKKNVEITFYSKAVKLVKKDSSKNYRELDFQDTLVFNCPSNYDINDTTVTRV